MVANEEKFGLILECGAKVLWLRNLPRVDKVMKRFRLKKEKQLDLFDNTTNTTSSETGESQESLPLDKVND